MKTKQHPEFSDKYPAIDGIKKEHDGYDNGDHYVTRVHEQEAIRSDVLEILNLDGIKFDSWYRSKTSSLLDLLNSLRIVVKVPDLRYMSESQKLGLDASSGLKDLIETLERGLEYVEVIKKVRDDMKD